MAIYERLLCKDFVDTNVLLYYATALAQQNRWGLAANLFGRVVDLDAPKELVADALQGIGNCFRAEGNHDAAEVFYREALKKSECAELWSNLGGLFSQNGTPHKALDCYDKALKLKPGDKSILFNVAMMYHELGLWDKAFPLYEECLDAFHNGKRRKYDDVPYWDGSPGKTLIVYGDQGIGDEIMFASCIPDAQKISKKIIFDCHPRLVKTFKRSFPDIEVHGTRKNSVLPWLESSGAEASEALSTMPRFFRKKDEDFPKTPYLLADPATVSKHRSAGSNRLRVGISWKGGIKGTRTDVRSMPLEALLPILENDCDFYSLQYTPEGEESSSKEVCQLEERHGIRVRHYPGYVESKDYDQTVNFVASMDLVISVCTSVIHVAGALGVPCWVLVPSKPAWRYGLEGSQNTWYGSVKHFRQKPGETWSPVINKIARELRDFRAVPGTESKDA